MNAGLECFDPAAYGWLLSMKVYLKY